MHCWSFGKHKRKYITDNDIEMKFGLDVISSPANSRKRELITPHLNSQIILPRSL